MSQNDGTSYAFQEASKQIFRKIARDDTFSKKGCLEFDWKNKWLKGCIFNSLQYLITIIYHR